MFVGGEKINNDKLINLLIYIFLELVLMVKQLLLNRQVSSGVDQ